MDCRKNKKSTVHARSTASGTQIRNMLESRCVITMVLSKPMRFATSGAAIMEKAVMTSAMKKMRERDPRDTPYRTENHVTSSNFTIKPPPSASMENNAEIFATTSRVS